ncbi:hypothetical protein CBL_12772 [Carabus blaptoides fortunei]
MDPNIRKTWSRAVGLNQKRVSKSGKLRCCEDHFDLQNDAENWIQFTMIATNLRLKKNVVPHLNLDVKDVINRQSQISPSSRKRKEDNIKNFISNKKQVHEADSEPSTTKDPDNSPNVWSSSGDFQVNKKTVNLRKSVGINTYIEKCHKAVQCNLIKLN